jgi:hypothetical protein
VSELKAQLKRQTIEGKVELKVKIVEHVELHCLVKFYKKEQKFDEAEISKLQAAYIKEKASLSSSRMIYTMAYHNIDTLAEVVKELNSLQPMPLPQKKCQVFGSRHSHPECVGSVSYPCWLEGAH